ncbi:MAG TPA: aminotransferase class I/II-fold pyridoxal phosphate-dependent enzyme [Terriglobales bacterium]|nr:aminotransferase class I/II-fold pyridoxal phosphate-dependent enzyme [Terriglobales bacterium]
MNSERADAVSHYLAWAKLHSGARFNLSSSGILDYPLSELPVKIEDLDIGGTGPYGYEPLMERLAAKTGAPRESIVYTFGTSMANFVALTALVHRGDEVLVERPTYDPLLTILEHIGAKVSRFERRAEKGFKIGLGELERKLTPQTRLVVLCNLHNPSSAFIDENAMLQVGEMAAKIGARVLVDEVYLETLFDHPVPSAFHLGENFVITSSLTKAYGLSGIRCGWVLAQPELVQRMWQIVDFTYGSPVHPAELLAVIALDNLDRVRHRARTILETNRILINEFLARHPELDCPASTVGTTIFPRLKLGRTAEFLKMLRDQFDTSVVPGDFFEQPLHFRIGFGGATEMVRDGLDRVSTALGAFQQQFPKK